MNKTALITGAARGIGRGIAEALAAEGFSIAINAVSEESAAVDALNACKEKGAPSVVYCRGDISQPSDRQNILEMIKSNFGRLDVLVNNAGVGPKVRMDILETTEESYDRVMGINLKGPFFLTQLLSNYMIENKKKDPAINPMIINVSSISSFTSSTFRGEYCISKSGISMMTLLFADRLAEFGINVYEVQPGIIMTDMTSGVKEKYDNLIGNGLTPIKRWGYPEDVAKAVVAFAKGLFPFSTGETVHVDGGFHFHRL